MIDFVSYPVFRQGQVIDFSNEISRKSALAVAQRILEKQSRFVDIVKENLRSNGCDKVRSHQSEKIVVTPESKLKIWPTVVVDFPQISFCLGGERLFTRTCLTICANDRQSKVWTRINLLERNIPAKLMGKAFDRLQKISEQINEKIISEYQMHFSQEIDSANKLQSVFAINVRTVAVNDAKLGKKIREQQSIDTSRIKTKVDPFLKNICFLDSSFGLSLGSKPKKSKRSSEIYHFSTFRSPVYSDDNFVTHAIDAIYLVNYDNNVANFVGIANDELLDEIEPLESVSHVVSSNLAQEIGGLF